MKLDEIITADEKIRLARLIFNNTFNQLANEMPHIQRPIATSLAKPVVAKPKSRMPKRAPMAPPPKPLPKAKPLPQTPAQIKHQQHKNQQDYAQAVKKTFNKDGGVKMPKSLQPLPGNIISPIGGGDPELNKKLDQARKDYELQNRSSGSKPQSFL
jgi:hypothetical protein